MLKGSTSSQRDFDLYLLSSNAKGRFVVCANWADMAVSKNPGCTLCRRTKGFSAAKASSSLTAAILLLTYAPMPLKGGNKMPAVVKLMKVISLGSLSGFAFLFAKTAA